MPTIAILGTFDTKGREHAFVAELVRAQGFATTLIDVGSLHPPTIVPDITAQEVAAGGDHDWRAILDRKDRGECVALMAKGAAALVSRLAVEQRIHGIISLGGGSGSAIAAAAMRSLPIAFPKVLVSTIASGNLSAYVSASDIAIFPSVVDVAGLNRISRPILSNAASAICGMTRAAVDRSANVTASPPIIVASMFGNTTACVTEAQRLMEAAGYEVLIFHATGTGGRNMEALIASGLVSGVLDITTTEWADELVGGILGAGPERLEAAGKAGIPAVVVPGCLDMVNFGEPSTVPSKFSGRLFYQHNPQATLMRTNAAECAELGRILAGKVNRYTAPVTVLLPRGGISIISSPGQPFHDPEADDALFSSLRTNLRSGVTLIESDLSINDPDFARVCTEALLASLERVSKGDPA